METDRATTKTFHTDLSVQSTHNEVALLDAYKPAFSSWNLSNDDVYELIAIIYDFTDNIEKTDAKISIDYSPILKDTRIELHCDGKILKSYNKETQIEFDDTTDIFGIKPDSDEQVKIPVIVTTTTNYEYDRFVLKFTTRFEGLYFLSSKKAMEAIKILSDETEQPTKVIQRILAKGLLTEENQHFIEVKSRRGLVDCKIEIDGKDVVFKRGDKMFDFMDTLLFCSNGLRGKADIENVYEKLYPDDPYLVSKNDIDGKKRKANNIDDLYQRIRRINDKVRRDTGFSDNFIVKEGERYFVNPVLTVI